MQYRIGKNNLKTVIFRESIVLQERGERNVAGTFGRFICVRYVFGKGEEKILDNSENPSYTIK